MGLNERANIGVQHENMQKNVSIMIKNYNDLETKFYSLVNAYYNFEDSFSGNDLAFLKDYLKDEVDNVVQINENETNKICIIQDVLNAYEGQVTLMNQEITQTASSLNDNLLEKGLE